MKRLVALLGLVVCLAAIVLAVFMVQGAFVAKTAQHEGIMAQASLLLGGLLIAAFTYSLGRLCLRVIAAPDQATGA